ncbi:MAG: hypothetical protein IJS52_03105 [Bacilli bacterium]|nr:hypothetical protein [Bacilli bacterium]
MENSNLAKERPIINARKINKMRCISGIVLCALVIVLTAVAFTLNITDYYKDTTPEAGIGTLRMFTTISNLFAALAAFMCLPFQIDGLRRDHYKLPSWIVILMYVGAVGVFLTFTIASTLISFAQGFVQAMFVHSNLFMHLINPLAITLLFAFIISDVPIRFRYGFLAMVPVTAYAFLYFIMVFVVGQWRDVYQANAFIPWPVTLVLMLLLTFGLSQLLRVLHNLTHRYVERNLVRYYKESPDYDFPRVSDAVAKLAEVESKFYRKGDDIYIPVDIIGLLSDRFGAASIPVDILYDIYLEHYIIHIKKRGQA